MSISQTWNTGGLSQNEYYAYTQKMKRRRDAFTEEQHEFLDKMEEKWRDSLPSYTLAELMEIYPEGKKAARRAIHKKIKEVKKQLSSLSEFREVWSNSINKAKPKDQPELIRWLNEQIDTYEKEYEHQLKKHTFQLQYLDSLENESLNILSTLHLSRSRIKRAKQVPIDSLLSVNRGHKALCVFHTEKRPSMHVYKDHVYCFSCAKSGDSIDVYMALHKCDFKTAVRALAP